MEVYRYLQKQQLDTPDDAPFQEQQTIRAGQFDTIVKNGEALMLFCRISSRLVGLSSQAPHRVTYWPSCAIGARARRHGATAPRSMPFHYRCHAAIAMQQAAGGFGLFLPDDIVFAPKFGFIHTTSSHLSRLISTFARHTGITGRHAIIGRYGEQALHLAVSRSSQRQTARLAITRENLDFHLSTVDWLRRQHSYTN